MEFCIRKGLDLPITGKAQDQLDESKTVDRVAVLGSDYIGMKPTMLVKEGDQVKIGQPLFSCKKNIGLTFTSPAAGKVIGIHRGERRVFESLEIAVDQNEEQVSFQSYKNKSVDDYTSQEVKALLLESGLWASLRQRPFEKVADVNGDPNSVFVTAVDTHPLAPNPEDIVVEKSEAFKAGVLVLSQLAKTSAYVCVGKGSKIDVPVGAKVKKAEFSGPHPAGNVGTHIHHIDPVNPNKYVWHVGYQNTIAIGHLFLTGEITTERVVSLAGPRVKNPRQLKTRIGAKISQLVKDEVEPGSRVISGSVLHGHKAEASFDFLSYYSHQISGIEEDENREFLGWHKPGFDSFSVKNIYVSRLMPNKKFSFGSSLNGSYRAMVPIGSYEKVMPLDILPTQLLRSLVSEDTDSAQDLGCLELAEEDLALLTFVSPGKVDFGPILRDNLTKIEREG